MRRVMGVAFGPFGRLHFLDPGDADYRVGDRVLFPTEFGPEVARCVWGPAEVEWDGGALPLCPGPATADDLVRDVADRARREEIRGIAQSLVNEHRLPMSIVAVDHAPRPGDTARQSIVYFKAPQRVDFRRLLGDLTRALQSRVDLRQVGGRDTAALVGGVGPCGLGLCCCAGCPVSEPLSGRLSHDQEAANSALQLAGMCGRVKCCLAFEQDAYADFLARAPKVGSVVDTASGQGVVQGLAMPIDSVWVRTDDGVVAVAVTDVTVLQPPPSLEPRGRAARQEAVEHVGVPSAVAAMAETRTRNGGRTSILRVPSRHWES